MNLQETTTLLLSVHPTKQLQNLANTGTCWFDQLLDELSEITGYTEEVETLQNYAHMVMMTEDWQIIKKLAANGKLLQEMQKAGTHRLASQTRGLP